MSTPTSGPVWPACEVVKNRGSNPEKSFSSSILPMSTDPTIPRHPTNPILSIVLTPDGKMMKNS
jgi:hypothetical protein